MEKLANIHHGVDLDGWMSGKIVQKKYELDLDVVNIPYNYGEDIPDLSEYSYVVMCDISFPPEKMKELFKEFGDNLIWIDHHISAINDSYTYGYDGICGHRGANLSACELTYAYMHGYPVLENVAYLPPAIELLGLYDTMRDKSNATMYFQLGMQAIVDSVETIPDWTFDMETDMIKNTIISGSHISKYLKTTNKKLYADNCSKFVLNGMNVATINAKKFNPINSGINYHDDGYDIFISYYNTGKGWSVSIYNDDESVDCSKIAKEFGGGGHKGAAGFVVDDINELFDRLE
jgi:oligoribonuclease NrnB/cAMP/cGMP phosphodiesterase (DHH superfamily)